MKKTDKEFNRRKEILLVCFLFFSIITFSQNQLSNTKWKGIFLIPHSVDVLLDFKKDTLYMTDEKNQEIGTFIFSQRKDTLTISKISGQAHVLNKHKELT